MKANKVLFFGIASGLGMLLWFELHQRKSIEQDPDPKANSAAESKKTAETTPSSGPTTVFSNKNTNLRISSPVGSTLSDAAIRDGQNILSIGVPDFQTAYRKLTNSGVEPNQAKTLLRPILWHLSYIATCNRFITERDQSEYEFLERIRQDTTRTVEDREGTMDILAVTNRKFRETWMAKRQARMEAFSQLVADLKVDHPEDLLRDLLLVQPSFPPPDPPPP